MVTAMPWLLMIAFAGTGNLTVSLERFETKELCESAASGVVKFYVDSQFFAGQKPRAWECKDITVR